MNGELRDKIIGAAILKTDYQNRHNHIDLCAKGKGFQRLLENLFALISCGRVPLPYLVFVGGVEWDFSNLCVLVSHALHRPTAQLNTLQQGRL